MARPEEARGVQKFEEAKTAEEKIRAWGCQSPGRDMDRVVESWRLYIDRKPEIIESFAHKPLWEIMDRGILDRKSRELIMLALMMQIGTVNGTVGHVANAKAAGITEEEIMEVAAIVCYEGCKDAAAKTCALLTEAFKRTANVTVYRPD